MPQVSHEQEELKDDDSTYHKRIEELLEDAEIEAEIETEKKVRSKNTRLLTISLVAIALIAFIYLQVKTGSQATSTENNASGPLPELAKAPTVAKNEIKPTTPGTEKAEPPEIAAATAETPPPEPVAPVEKLKAPVVVETPPKAPEPVAPVEKLKAPVVVEAPPKVPASVEPVKVPAVAANVKKPAKLQPAAVSPPTSTKQYHVQLGVFSVEDNANRLLKNLKNKGFKPSIDTRATQAPMYVVYLGGFTSKEDGSQAITDLKAKGFSPVMEKFENNSNTIILGKFKNAGQAAALRDKLSIQGFLSSAKKSQVQTDIHVVRLGPFTSLPQAKKTKNSIERAGFKNSFIR